MKLLSTIATTLLLVALVSTISLGNIAGGVVEALSPVPSFTLNLDLPPEQRWNGAVETIIKAHGWDNSFGPVLDLYMPVTWLIPEEVVAVFNNIMKTRFPEYYGEVMGIYNQLVKYGQVNKIASAEKYMCMPFAYEILHLNILPQALHQNLDVTRRRIAQYLESKAREYALQEGRTIAENEDASFVFTKACTGILSLPTNKSENILHMRNMDEQPSAARNLTLKITAIKNNNIEWEALDWLWVSGGVETSQRRDGITMEMNYRRHFEHAAKENFTFTEMVNRLSLNTTIPVLLFQRVVHDRKLNYDSLIEFSTKEATFAAPFYTIAAGTGRRGVVLTLHYRREMIIVAKINDTFTYSESDGVPFALVQTNYDIDQPDNMNDPRRTVAQDTLRMMSRDRAGTELGVWMALSVYPVHNPSTFYTAMMSVEGEEIEGYVRRAMVPQKKSPLEKNAGDL